jgi:hypothetical protein
MEQCVPKRAYKLHTPVNHPEESIQLSEHGGSLKSRTLLQFEFMREISQNMYKEPT